MHECPDCTKSFTTRQALGSHRRTHAEPPSRLTRIRHWVRTQYLIHGEPLWLWRRRRHERPRSSGPCCSCGALTSGRRLVVSADLKRRKPYVCNDCAIDDGENRTARTQRDWREVTDPIRRDRVVLDTMPEQYPGISREALRAFLDSDASRAVVPDASPSSLNQTIAALGLAGEVYAEERSGQTVLRRISRVA